MKNKFDYKKYKIIDRTEFTHDTVLFKFEGKIDFEPGQFIQVALEHYGEVTFAICSDKDDKKKFEICVRGCGNTTNQIVKLLPSDHIQIRGPYGHGWPIGKLLGKNILLIAGGMGIVPIRPLILELLKYKSEFKKITLVVGCKNSEHILFENDLKYWNEKFDLNLCAEFTHAGFWGRRGIITQPLKNIEIENDAVAIICGPEVMFQPITDLLIGRGGLEENNIYISFERRMECGIGICQHCNIGKYLVCKDGPVFRWDKIKSELNK